MGAVAIVYVSIDECVSVIVSDMVSYLVMGDGSVVGEHVTALHGRNTSPVVGVLGRPLDDSQP